MEIADMAIRRRRFIREDTQLLDYFKPKEVHIKVKTKTNRRTGRMTEREEVSSALT